MWHNVEPAEQEDVNCMKRCSGGTNTEASGKKAHDWTKKLNPAQRLSVADVDAEMAKLNLCKHRALVD